MSEKSGENPLCHLLLSMNSSSLSAAVLSLSRSFSLRFFLFRAAWVWLLIGRWLSFPSSDRLVGRSLPRPAPEARTMHVSAEKSTLGESKWKQTGCSHLFHLFILSAAPQLFLSQTSSSLFKTTFLWLAAPHKLPDMQSEVFVHTVIKIIQNLKVKRIKLC